MDLKHFITVDSLDIKDYHTIFSKANKYQQLNSSNNKKTDILSGKTICNLFFENSTRTKNSFETAAKRLGADVINFDSNISSSKKGESLTDTLLNLDAMNIDLYCIRHSMIGAMNQLTKISKAPIINAGAGQFEHPTQALLDIFTILEYKKSLKNLNISIIGDIEHSRVAKSNVKAMSALGANVCFYGPSTVMPRERESFSARYATSLEDALDSADVVMLLRIQRERGRRVLIPSEAEYNRFFGLNNNSLSYLKKDAIIMHPGPVNRGVEITSQVLDSDPRAVVTEQVEKGVAVRMALIDFLINK